MAQAVMRVTDIGKLSGLNFGQEIIINFRDFPLIFQANAVMVLAVSHELFLLHLH